MPFRELDVVRLRVAKPRTWLTAPATEGQFQVRQMSAAEERERYGEMAVGSVGTIVDVHRTGQDYLVEFLDGEGRTVGLIGVADVDLELVSSPG